MIFRKLSLIAAVLFGFGLIACTGQADPVESEETLIQEPTLTMFYTDN
ncbi:MAG: hypothetical protein DHS20C20_17930 [Ardenticatenaceae bacterium]|nr:MAG: hypothetical protein DHS20C20_17930 [Ardenticatenaceae bacterium]